MLRMLTSAALSTAALTVALTAANAAPPEFCHDYAEAAINQVRAALADPRCAGAVHGPRWTSDRRVHFQWCLSQPIPAVEAERGARGGYLHACRHG